MMQSMRHVDVDAGGKLVGRDKQHSPTFVA
jgi:hypothetical protein